jgi:hypothetical protein
MYLLGNCDSQHATTGCIHAARASRMPVSAFIMLLSINKHPSQVIAFMYEIMHEFVGMVDRYIAEHALDDAVESSIYMCGMPSIGEGSSCHAILKCNLELS